MQCAGFEQRLNALLDERRTAEVDRELQAHAAVCNDCRELLAAYDLLFEGLAAATPAEAPADLALRVAAAMQPLERPTSGSRVLAALLAVAAAVLVTVLPLVRFLPSNSLDQVASLPDANVAPQSPSVGLPSGANASASVFRQELPLVELRESGPKLAAVVLQFPGMGLAHSAVAASELPQPAWMTPVADSLRPLTNSMNEAWNAVLRTLPRNQRDSRS